MTDRRAAPSGKLHDFQDASKNKGQPPLLQWLQGRQEYIKHLAHDPPPRIAHPTAGTQPTTDDGVLLPNAQ